MGTTTTLFRFRIDLSDVERGIYEALDFRVAMHPSESMPYLLTRTLAYCLNIQEGLEFSPGGLNDPDAPALVAKDRTGSIFLWIEIGNPNPRKLHKASKAAPQVKVYTYKNPEQLVREGQAENIHRADQIEIFAFETSFLDRLAQNITRDVRWSLLYNDHVLTVSTGNVSEQTEVKKFSFQKDV